MNIKGANVLITGGSLGIGKETARVLVDAGAQVAITGRDAARLEQAAADTGAFPIVADVSKPGDIDKTYEAFLDKFDGLDCLVNNAGIGAFKSIDDLTLEELEAVYRVNVFGAALMGARAARIFKKQNRGNIINIASTAALGGFANGTIYSSSKFALRGMTECWRAELRKHNVRVFLINPSEVATAFANPARKEREAPPNKLTSREVAHAIRAVLEMEDRGFIPELSIWATNPW
jgi:3-oxoacyl-[acyl-carrier protein] reductase